MTEAENKKPVDLKRINGGYLMSWTEHNLVIRITRLDVHKDGHVTAFVKIAKKQGEKTFTLLPASQFNLSAPRTRSELVNGMTEKDSQIPWREIIELLCREIQELAWVGEPGELLEVHENSEIKRPGYLVEPIIMNHVPNVIFGEKGAHKTTLSLLFCYIAWLPWHDNPFNLTTNGKPAKITMLDWESDRDLTTFTIQRLLKGMHQPGFDLSYRRCNFPLPDDLEQIGAFLDEAESNTVLIDSLGAACGGDLMKPEIALRFFTALRSLNRTSLLIGQTSKSEEGKKTLFGSTYFQYYARNIFEVKKSTDLCDKEETKVALFHTESNYSAKYDPLGFRLNFTPETIQVTREPVDYAEFIEKVNRQQQILEMLKDGPLSNNEIADKLQISQSNVRMTTKRLADKKRITRVGDNGERWGLLYADA